jgi:hypothetical protein
MIDPMRSSAALVGLAIIGCVAHAAVVSAGGYVAPGTPLLLALAAGLAVGAVAVGAAWRDGRHAIAALIGVALFAGEAYALLLTSERVLEAREGKQAPLRAQLALREQAKARVRAAEAALAATTTTVRLERALAAKAAADQAVVEKAAEKGCAVHCRALLEQQVATAAAEINAARLERAGLQRAAESELEAARAALAMAPIPSRPLPVPCRFPLGLAHG